MFVSMASERVEDMTEQTETTIDIDAVVDGYIECALWSSVDFDTDRPLDDEYGPDDLSAETLTQMRADCEAFCKAEADDLVGIDPGQVGHDFWLTRNHHGAGFWDRGLGERGEKLTRAAQAYGSVDLYVGDDGQIHSC